MIIVNGVRFEPYKCHNCEFSIWDEEAQERLPCDDLTEEECGEQYEDAEWL